MKEIRAYIQPFMLSKVTQALMSLPDFKGMSVSDCDGFGQEMVLDAQAFEPFTPKKRLEIFATDAQVERIVQTLLQTANTLQAGAGKVYIIDVEQGYRIRSAEQGADLA